MDPNPKYSTMDSALKSNYDYEIQFPEQPIRSKPNLKELLDIFEQHKPPPLPQKNFDYPLSANEVSTPDLSNNKKHIKYSSKEDVSAEDVQTELFKKLQARREEQQRNFIKQQKIEERNLSGDTISDKGSNSEQKNIQKLQNEIQKDNVQNQNKPNQLQPQHQSIQQNRPPSISNSPTPSPKSFVIPQEQIQQIRTISTASGLNVSMEDLIILLKEEKVNHQITKTLLKSVTDENNKLRNENQTWKSRFYKSSTKLQKVDIILKHFDTIMKEDTPTPSFSSPPSSPSFNSSIKDPLASAKSPSLTSDHNPVTPISVINGGNSGSSYSGFGHKRDITHGGTLTSSILKSMDPNSFLIQQQDITNGTEGLDLTDDEFISLLEKRKVIALQVLKTEKEYAQHLGVIVEEFLQPIKNESHNSNNSFVTPVNVKQIFGDVEVILGSSKLLIEDLENFILSPSPTGLGDVFLKVCDYFKLYSPYVNNYYTSISVLNKMKEESHKFNTFITERETALGIDTNFNDLGSLLVLPVTRIGSYTHMLTELFYSTPFSHPDYEPFKKSVYKMKSIVINVKEKTREHENQNKVRLIQNSMTGKFKNLNLPHRRYVKEGEIPEVTNGKTSSNLLYLFLFNDILIVASKKSSTPTSYQFKKEIKLLDAEVTVINEDERPMFQITYINPVEESASKSDSPNALIEQVLIFTNNTPLSNSSNTDIKLPTRDSITFCASSPKDREEWYYQLSQNIANTNKINDNRKQEDVLEYGKGEIDFQNSDIQLCELLGKGGSGCSVHRCTVDGFTCAVKILKLKNTQSFLIDQFVGEINIMVQLSHSNIAKYLGHRLTHNPDQLWLFMEYYPYSLQDIISKRSNTPFPPSELIWMALELAKGLDFLHSQKPPIIHRDLKPGNIMCSLDDKNRVNNIRLCDFDTSRTLAPGVSLKTCIGTPCYMAAEVLDVGSENSEGYTLKADIWSFAMLIFELISLLPPYHQFDHLNSIEMILKGTPPPLPTNVSPQLQPLIDYLLQCIDLNPSKRPSSNSLVNKLSKILKNSGKYQAQSDN